MSRLRCLEGGFGLWLGDKGIVNGKMSTSTYILIGYGPTPPSFSLTARRKHSREDIKLVEELSLGFPSRSNHQSTVTRVTSRCNCRNPNPLAKAP
jgi:hypothetical protein